MDLLAKYLSALALDSSPSLRAAARAFQDWLGDRSPTRDVLDLYQQHLVGERYAAGTVQYRMAVVRRMCRVNEVEWPYRRGEGVMVGERDVERPYFTPSMGERLIRTAGAVEDLGWGDRQGAEIRAWLALSTTYGLRREELAGMTPEDFNLGGGLVYVETAKRGRQRYHLLPAEILPVLSAYYETPHYEVRSRSYLSARFKALRIATKHPVLVGDDSYGTGYHSFRRALVHAWTEAGLTDAEQQIAGRWKGGASMPSLYRTGVAIGEEGRAVEQGFHDERIDRKALAANPFLVVWEEVAAGLRAKGRL